MFSTLKEYIQTSKRGFCSIEKFPVRDGTELIKRRKEGGGNLIKHFTSILKNGGNKRVNGYLERIMEWTQDSMRSEGMECLKHLIRNVCGSNMECWSYMSVRRRMREVWMKENEEGKEDEEGRREVERRRRELGDIMNEEDVMETSIMHLCIPDYKMKETDGMLVRSWCSKEARMLFDAITNIDLT